jgi:hypothetical protein
LILKSGDVFPDEDEEDEEDPFFFLPNMVQFLQFHPSELESTFVKTLSATFLIVPSSMPFDLRIDVNVASWSSAFLIRAHSTSVKLILAGTPD